MSKNLVENLSPMLASTTRRVLLASLCWGLFATGCIRHKSGSDVQSTEYINPAGSEVEVDIEGDISAPSADKIFQAPAEMGQFALSFMSKTNHIYLESIVTDASSPDRVEWLVGGVWLNHTQAAKQAASKLTHFRIRGMNAILLRDAQKNVKVGTQWTAIVPIDPLTVFEQAGATCADPDEEDHWAPDDLIYWYLWNPSLAGCKAKTQKMTLTVSKTFSTHAVYPEYDKLTANGKITSVQLFTALGDFPPLAANDEGTLNAAKAAKMFLKDGYTEVPNAPVGRRFTKTVNKVVLEMDIYSPKDFAGLGDDAHFANFQRAILEHQIIFFDGHSKLGESDFWARLKYPRFYQILVYGGCLGYQYYVAPIVKNKGDWKNLDVVSSVFEVGATATELGVPFFKDLMLQIQGKQPASWQQILGDLKKAVEATEVDEPKFLPDTSFGVSGARDNCWTPSGSTCK